MRIYAYMQLGIYTIILLLRLAILAITFFTFVYPPHYFYPPLLLITPYSLYSFSFYVDSPFCYHVITALFTLCLLFDSMLVVMLYCIVYQSFSPTVYSYSVLHNYSLSFIIAGLTVSGYSVRLLTSLHSGNYLCLRPSII